jgi:hypothetical protein
MFFDLDNGKSIISNMINVHVVTGGLTAIAITAGLFGFVLTADSRRIAERLRIMGYSSLTINLGWFTALLSVLFVSAMVTSAFVIYLYKPVSAIGMISSIFLTTIVYTAFGYLIGILYPRVLEGTLIVLLVSFIDLMLLSNPMGAGIYLSDWTKIIPGFWPTQIALESAFIDIPTEILLQSGIVLVYASILLLLAQLSQPLKGIKLPYPSTRGARS